MTAGGVSSMLDCLPSVEVSSGGLSSESSLSVDTGGCHQSGSCKNVTYMSQCRRASVGPWSRTLAPEPGSWLLDAGCIPGANLASEFAPLGFPGTNQKKKRRLDHFIDSSHGGKGTMTQKYKLVRWFYISSGAAIVVIILCRFFVLPSLAGPKFPSPWETTGHILDVFLAALLASVAVTSLREWLSPAMETAMMEIIEPYRIREVLRQALEKTGEWCYRGHSGRHFRAVTLPLLAEDARARNIAITIRLQILDPSDAQTCLNYANYRRSLSSAAEAPPWTPERARDELIATIMSAYAWKAKMPRLDVKVALMSTLSLFRVDLSSRVALITKEAKQEPAIKFDEGTIFYTTFRDDLALSFQQAKSLPDSVQCVPLEELTVACAKQLILDLGFGTLNLDAAAVQKIISIAQAKKNPYE